MKSALVLGLAFTANAYLDNKLVTSLPSGTDLLKSAGWDRSLPTHTRPIYTTKFDEVADDELTMYGPEGITVPFPRRNYRAEFARDDADDELTMYGPEGITVPFPRRNYRAEFARDDADDELLVNLWSPSGSDLANHRGRPATDARGRPYTDTNGNILGRPVYRDDVADDEMTMYGPEGITVPFPRRNYRAEFARDDADDELTMYGPEGITVPFPRRNYRAEFARDDEADDEMTMYGPEGITVPFPRRNYRAEFARDDADDELTMYGPEGITVPFPRRNYRAEFVRDDADDELALLGSLIKEAHPEKVEKKTHEKSEIRRHLRHEKN